MSARRGRPPGHPKSGGRERGTPNRSTQAIRELFEELNFDPIRELVKMAKDPKVPRGLKANVLTTLCSYRFPRPKSADESVPLEKIEVVTRIEPQEKASDGGAETGAEPKEQPDDSLPE
jgi:hypothetical protein